MKNITTTKENLSNLFYYLTQLYDYENFPDVSAVYQFELTEKEEIYHFYMEVSNGKAHYEEKKHKNPSLTIYAPVSVWYDIASGKMNGALGLMTKKFRIEGPLKQLSMFNKIFGKQFSEKEIPELKDTIKDFEKPQKLNWKKPENILIINASPRKKNGFTYLYLQYFIQGIEETGTKVEIIDLYDKKLQFEPCQGCFSCWKKTHGNCIIKDDATPIIEKIKNSYLTIYAFPLYVETVPAKLKALFDREFTTLSPVFVPYKNLTRHPLWNTKERYMAIFGINGFPELEHFKPVVQTFKGISRDSHRQILSYILRPGAQFLYSPPYRNFFLEVTESLHLAGKQLMEKGIVSKKLLKSISNEFNISKSQWRNQSNMYWYLERKQHEHIT